MRHFITKHVRIDPIHLTSQDWQLYHDYLDQGIDPHGKQTLKSQHCAAALNKAFTQAVNAGQTRYKVYAAVDEVMVKFSDCGAVDTEPEVVLLRLLDEVFGP